MSAQRRRLLNTSDTPCDLIALAIDAIKAPATFPAARSRFDHTKSLSASRNQLGKCPSAAPFHFPEEDKDKAHKVEISTFVENETAFRALPEITSLVGGIEKDKTRSLPCRTDEGHRGCAFELSPSDPQPGRLSSPGILALIHNDNRSNETSPDGAAHVMLDPNLLHITSKEIHTGLENKEKNDLHEPPCGSSLPEKNSGAQALGTLKRGTECFAEAFYPSATARNVIKNELSSQSSDFSRSEAAFEAERRIIDRRCPQERGSENKMNSLVVYSLSSDEMLSGRENGSSSARDFKPLLADASDRCLEHSSAKHKHDTHTSIPVPFGALLKREHSAPNLDKSGRAQTSMKQPYKNRGIRRNESSIRDWKNATRKDKLFSRPTGSQFDELVSEGSLDKHLWMQERKLHGNHTARIRTARLDLPPGTKKRPKKALCLRFLG